jgi:iron complex outermembrane recepter protein
MESNKARRHVRLMSSAATGVLLLLSSGGLAYAQDAADATDEEIVVTGFRASLANSVNTKRNSSSIVEAVSAEDIGKLPDNSIAESLARLPGLSAQRLFGRSQQISVRGLSPDFTTALLNGREQVSAGDNRGVEFDQYPSELLSSVVVYKTPDASLIGQGLAGTADMRTVRPLNVDGRVFAASARYEWNDVGALNAGTEDTGHRITLSYIDQSADGHWGWAIGAATMSSPTQAERWEAWGYPGGDNTNPVGDPLSSDVLVLGGAKPYVQSSLLDRTGVMGVLQYQPTSTFSTTLDVFYSEFEEVQTLRGIELPLWWSSAQLQPGYTVEDGLVTEGTFANVFGVVRNDIRSRNSTVKAVGWNTEWDVGDDWTVSTDLSYSEVERNDLDLETYSGTGFTRSGPPDTLDFEQGEGGGFVFSSALDYSDPSLIMLTDPQGWGGGAGQAGFLKEPQTNDQLTSLRLSAERELSSVFSSMEFGINFSEREKDKVSIEHFVDLVGGNTTPVPVPAAYLQAPTSLDFLGIPAMISYDPRALIADGGIYELRELLNSDVLIKAWGVEERVTTAYTQLNVDSVMFTLPVSGNVGLQIVHTDQSSTGGVMTNSGPQVVSDGDTFVEILPSLNLSWDLTDDDRLRLGIARTLARPRMDDMRASFVVNYNLGNIAVTDPSQSYWSGNGGNPRLRPWIANSFDLSYEHYLGGAGYVSLAAFYKQLESYIYPERVVFDFTGFPTQNPGDMPATNFGLADTPQNAQGGYIQGLEFTASIPGEEIFSALEGFGVVFNASSTDSDIRPPNTPGSGLPGLSETVINTTIYYEIGGFEARISNRYRSDFLGEVTGFGAGRELRMVKGESVVDAQLGYRFETGALDGLSLLFQANNLTDEAFSTFESGDERRVRDHQVYGRTFLVGLSYRR